MPDDSLDSQFFSEEATKQALLDYGYELNFVRYGIEEAPVFLGSLSSLIVPGYIALIKSYINSHEGEHKALKEFALSLRDNLIYEISSSGNKDGFAEKIYQKLQSKGEAYINFASNKGKHENFMKFSKTVEGKYNCTIYNAGEFITTPQKMVASIYETTEEYLGITLLPSDKLEEAKKSGMEVNLRYLPHFTQKDKILPIYPAVTYPIKDNMEMTVIAELLKDSGKISNDGFKKKYSDLLGLGVLGSETVVSEQKVGNCGIRCILEALRGNIPDEEFREFYHYSVNNFYSDMLRNVGVAPSSLFASSGYIPKTNKEFMDVIEHKIRDRLKLDPNTRIEGLDAKCDFAKLMPILQCASMYFGSGAEEVEFVTNLIARDLLNLYKKENPGIVIVDTSNYVPDTGNTGFISAKKPRLISVTSNKFAKRNKLDEQLTQKLWNRMFAASYKDNDLPLSDEILKPVEGYLSKAIEKNKELSAKTFESILQDWRIGCLTGKCDSEKLANIMKDFEKEASNTDVHNMVKAPILKQLIDENKEQDTKLSKRQDLAEDLSVTTHGTISQPEQVVDYYKILHKSQQYKEKEAQLENNQVLLELEAPGRKLQNFKDIKEYNEKIDWDWIKGPHFNKNKSDIGKSVEQILKSRASSGINRLGR